MRCLALPGFPLPQKPGGVIPVRPGPLREDRDISPRSAHEGIAVGWGDISFDRSQWAPYPRRRTARFTRTPNPRRGTLTPQTESRRCTTPAPEAHLGFWSTEGNTCSGRTPVVLSRPTRCRILDGVTRLLPMIHAEKTGGSRPWTRNRPPRIEPSSPNGHPHRIDQRD